MGVKVDEHMFMCYNKRIIFKEVKGCIEQEILRHG